MNVTVIKQNESVIYGGKIYTHGMSFEADDAIGKSLVDRGYVALTASAEDRNEPDLQEASYTELKKMAARKGLSAVGKKDELIARIKEAEIETSEDSDEGELPNTDMPE